MNWITILAQLIQLEPEVFDLVTKIIGAINAAPAEHQAAVKAAASAAKGASQ